MRKDEIITVNGKAGAYRLLYSHDDGFTRHVIEIRPDGYLCRLNESVCFRRGTHDRMAKVMGIDLTSLPVAKDDWSLC